MKKIVLCPSCEGEIELSEKIELGQLVRCPNCYDDLKIVELHPIELDWPYEEKEWTAQEDAGDPVITNSLPDRTER